VDGKKDRSADGVDDSVSLANEGDVYVGGTPEGRYLDGAWDFLRIAQGTLSDAGNTIEELYAWEFDGPQMRDFTDRKPTGARNAGAIEFAEPLVWKNTTLLSGAVADEITALKQQRGYPLRSIGSINLVKSMIQLRLVDRLQLMVFPLNLGSAGREPAYAGYPQVGLELTDTKVLDSRLILLEYRPAQQSQLAPRCVARRLDLNRVNTGPLPLQFPSHCARRLRHTDA
jgi:hypothetical protein